MVMTYQSSTRGFKACGIWIVMTLRQSSELFVISACALGHHISLRWQPSKHVNGDIVKCNGGNRLKCSKEESSKIQSETSHCNALSVINTSNLKRFNHFDGHSLYLFDTPAPPPFHQDQLILHLRVILLKDVLVFVHVDLPYFDPSRAMHVTAHTIQAQLRCIDGGTYTTNMRFMKPNPCQLICDQTHSFWRNITALMLYVCQAT